MKWRRTSTSSGRRVYIEYDRLPKLCAAIKRGTRPRREDLARSLGVSERTIQRDLRLLEEEFQAPIARDRERGLHFTDPNWQLPPLTLTEAELLGFFAAEHLIGRLGGAAEADLARRALRNLAAYLPKEVVVDFGALAEAIRFAPEPAPDTSPDVLRRLAEASNRRRTLNVHYYSQHSGMSTIRDVDVLALVKNHGEWYAIVFDHKSGEVRDFHAGRFRRIYDTDRTFGPPEGWDLDEYLRSGFGMFRGGGKVEVEVVFSAEQAPYVRERRRHETQVNEEMDGGRLRATFTTTEAALVQVTRWVMQYGEHAEAVRPKELREMVSRGLTAARRLYMVGGDDE